MTRKIDDIRFNVWYDDGSKITIRAGESPSMLDFLAELDDRFAMECNDEAEAKAKQDEFVKNSPAMQELVKIGAQLREALFGKSMADKIHAAGVFFPDVSSDDEDNNEDNKSNPDEELPDIDDELQAEYDRRLEEEDLAAEDLPADETEEEHDVRHAQEAKEALMERLKDTQVIPVVVDPPQIPDDIVAKLKITTHTESWETQVE